MDGNEADQDAGVGWVGIDEHGRAGAGGGVVEALHGFQADFNSTLAKGPGGIPYGDVLIPGLAMLCTGKSDFESVSQLRGSAWAARAFQVDCIASPETLRQNLDRLGESAFPISIEIIETAILDVLRNTRMRPSELWMGHVALDIDTTPQDNSKTKKEGVGRTYKGCDGYCPILAYAGLEGFLIGEEFRTGTQHNQKNPPAFIVNQIQRLRSLGVDHLLVRLDSGFDALETMLAIRGENADFIISVNPRGENQQLWVEQAKALPASAWVRPEGIRNLRIAYLERVETRLDKQGREIQERRIVRVHKRLMAEAAEEGGQTPILRAWVAYGVGSSGAPTYGCPRPKSPGFMRTMGTSEQFHSELKGELDLERLPSGKFKTNELVFQLGCLQPHPGSQNPCDQTCSTPTPGAGKESKGPELIRAAL